MYYNRQGYIQFPDKATLVKIGQCKVGGFLGLGQTTLSPNITLEMEEYFAGDEITVRVKTDFSKVDNTFVEYQAMIY